MANFFAKKKNQLMTFVSFGAYSLFFLFFCIGLVNLGGSTFGMSEMFDFFKDPVKYLLDGVIKMVISLFTKDGEWFSGEGPALFFIMGSFVFFVIFLVKFIINLIAFITTVSGDVEWDKAAEKFQKKFAWCFAFVLGYIVLAYMWMSNEYVDLSVCGIFFMIISILYFLGKAALDQFTDDSIAPAAKLPYMGIYGGYNVLKVVAAILALSFLVDRALILEFIYLAKDVFFALLHGGLSGGSKGEVIKDVMLQGVVPYISFILMFSALNVFQKALKLNYNNKEEKAMGKTKKALIVCGVALVIDLIVQIAVVEGSFDFGNWYDIQGSYFIWSLVFVGVSFGVYYLKQVADMLMAKVGGAAPAAEVAEAPAEEAPVAEPAAVAEAAAEEAPADKAE